jgi:hypothetical protein
MILEIQYLFAGASAMRPALVRVVPALLSAFFFLGGVACAAQSDAAAADTGANSTIDTPVKPLAIRPATPTYADDPKFQKALAEAKDKARLPADERLARCKHSSKIARNE